MIINAIRLFSFSNYRTQNHNQTKQQSLNNTSFDSVCFGAKITKPTKTFENILEIFDGECTDIPKHIKTMISSRTNKILGFTLKTSDKSDLKVMKKLSTEYGADLRYLSFEETLENGKKRYLNIDLDSNEFLKSSFAGKPIVEDGVLFNISREEAINNGIVDRLNKYIKDIFAKSNRKTAEESTVLAQKKAVIKKSKIKIEDINIDEFEDKKLNKLLENEFKLNDEIL